VRPGNTAGNAVQCPAGTYNPSGFTKAPARAVAPGAVPWGCRACPGGLTTVVAGASSAMACTAAKGYYFDAGKAVPCPLGFYKYTVSNENCKPCADGITTQKTASVEPESCNRESCWVHAIQGADAMQWIASGQLASPGEARRARWQLMRSQPATCCWRHPRLPVAPSITLSGNPPSPACGACLLCSVLEPGYGVDAQGNTTPCDRYSFGPGGLVWTPGTSQPCIQCPQGSITDTQGAVSMDDCRNPPGYGLDPVTNASSICHVGW
jgi:hypothetical protein